MAEAGFDAGARIGERKGKGDVWDVRGQTDGIAPSLRGNSRKSGAFWLGFDDTYGFLVSKGGIAGFAGIPEKLAHRYTTAGV